MCFWFVHIFLLRLLPSAIVTHCFHMCDRCHPCPLPWNPYPFASRLILPLICCTSCMHYFISLTTDTSHQRTESYWGHKAVCANGDKDKRRVRSSTKHSNNRHEDVEIVTPKMHLFHTCTKSPHKDTLIHVLLHVFSFGFAAALYLFAVIPISLWFPCIYFRKAKSQKKMCDQIGRDVFFISMSFAYWLEVAMGGFVWHFTVFLSQVPSDDVHSAWG